MYLGKRSLESQMDLAFVPRDRRRPSDAESQAPAELIHQLLVSDLTNSTLFLHSFFPFYPHIMDKLVAQYSRPQHQNDFYSEAEQQELTEGMPPLSLKFALPPVDNVSFSDFINRVLSI